MTNNLLILIRKFCKALLQHLPDFKGIETLQDLASVFIGLAAPPWLQRDWDIISNIIFESFNLQHLPDFKGIETSIGRGRRQSSPCSTSLTSKGLRPKSCLLNQRIQLAAPPWLQRDWDWHYPRHPLPVFLQHLPDFKGIETRHRTPYASATPLQHLPDFKGIETP